MSATGKNGLRMPFAEWLFRMAEADVPYQARGLATYAVLFKVSANDELAKLSGMDTKGIADKTYNKWKKLLADEGWVIVKSVTVGRETTIEIYPALETSPVTFTDISPRDPARFAQNKSYGREEQVTGESYGPAVTITSETEKVTDGKVTFTAEEKTSPAPARAEDNNNIYNNYNNLPKNTPPTSEQAAARGQPATPAPSANAGDVSLRDGETYLGHGVYVNCETIRHADFTISLLGIEMQLLGTVPMADIKKIATGHALQWALDLEAGKRNVVPSNTANFIRGSIQNRKNNDAVTDVRKARASSRHVPRPDGKSFADLNNEILAEIEQERRR